MVFVQHELLFLRREFDPLLPAYRICRRFLAAICHTPSFHLLHPLRRWFRVFCCQLEEGSLPVPVLTICMDPYDALVGCLPESLHYQQYL